MLKWNFKTKEYKEITPPKGWHVSIFESDMDKLINCAECGKLIPYGEGYTSKAIHTDMGFGYSVCSQCYQQELEESAK